MRNVVCGWMETGIVLGEWWMQWQFRKGKSENQQQLIQLKRVLIENITILVSDFIHVPKKNI